jgi:hypothetical protein
MTGPRIRRRRSAPVLVALAAALVGAAGCSGEADFSDAMPAPVTLSAEAFQAELMAIDRLVFEETPVTKERRAALAKKLEALSRRIGDEAKTSKSKFLVIEALEVRHFAEVAKGLPEKPPPQALLDNWMRLRNNLFDDRAWMARSARDLEPAVHIAR